MTGELDPALRELILLVNAHGSPVAVRALADLLNGRHAVLKLHHSTPTMFAVGSRRESRDCCAECEEGTYYPCPTVRALDV